MFLSKSHSSEAEIAMGSGVFVMKPSNGKSTKTYGLVGPWSMG